MGIFIGEAAFTLTPVGLGVKDLTKVVWAAGSLNITVEGTTAWEALSLGAEEGGGATFGKALSSQYRTTFFEAYPELEGQVVVHHAVEQQVLKRFPGIVTEEEIHSLENLRGIPKDLNNGLHLRTIRLEWNRFYKLTPNPTKEQLLEKASEIDMKFGVQFNPPIGGDW